MDKLSIRHAILAPFSKCTAVVAGLMISFALAFSGQAAAEVVLYGVANGAGTGGGGSGGSGGGTGPGTGAGEFSQFHIVDLNTGVATEISMDIGVGCCVSDLAINPSGVLFSSTGGRGPNDLGRPEFTSLLFTIDRFTGLGSVIGPMGTEFGPPQSAGLGPGDGDFDQFGSLRNNSSDMAFNPIDGVLYGMAARGSQLFTVDTGTGLATRIGAACDSPQIGAPGGFCRRGNGIAFDADGTLFWANGVEVAELDPSTGLIVGAAIPLDFTPFGPPDEPDAEFRVVGMAFHPLTDELYASVLQRQSQDIPAPRSTLAILDPLTGTFVVIGQVDGTGVKLEGIAFTPVPVSKTLANGPRIDDGGTLVDLTGLVTGSNDAGPIDVGRTDAQFYEFVIHINGDAEGTLDGAVATDVLPAEYDLDPQCGEDAAAEDLCDAAGDGDVDRDNDGNADGIINETPGACTVMTSTSGGGGKKGGEVLEPEFVDILLVDPFGEGDACTVRVFVFTDENPGRGNALFKRTGCRELEDGTFDTIALNDGVKLFDTESGERLFGPVGSLQLTPNNCL